MTQLDVIFGKPSDTAIDPVCKMTVQKDKPTGGSAEHAKKTYYFCAKGCRDAFVAEPSKFLGSDEITNEHMGNRH